MDEVVNADEQPGNLPILSSSPEKGDPNLTVIQKNVGALKIIDESTGGTQPKGETLDKPAETEIILDRSTEKISRNTEEIWHQAPFQSDSQSIRSKNSSTDKDDIKIVSPKNVGYITIIEDTAEGEPPEPDEGSGKQASSLETLSNLNIINVSPDASLKRKKSDKENVNRIKLKDEETAEGHTNDFQAEERGKSEKLTQPIQEVGAEDCYTDIVTEGKHVVTVEDRHDLDHTQTGQTNNAPMETESYEKKGDKDSTQGMVFGLAKTEIEKKRSSDAPVEYSSLFKVQTNTKDTKTVESKKTLLALAGKFKSKDMTGNYRNTECEKAEHAQDDEVMRESENTSLKDEINVGKDKHISDEMEKTNADNEISDEEEEENGGSTEPAKLSKNQRRRQRRREKQEQENAAKGQTDNSADQGKSKIDEKGKSQNPYSERHVLVHFHVLVSDEFKFDPKQHKLLMMIGDTKLGRNWESMDNELTFKGTFDTYIEMSYELKIPASLISYGDKGLEYKYLIYKPEKQGKRKNSSEENGMYWELYYRDKNTGKDINRILKLVDKWRNNDVWHQYEGVIMKNPKGMFDKWSHWWNKTRDMITHACLTAEHFCSDWRVFDAEGHSIEERIEQLEMLRRCLRKIYFTDFKCWDHETHFKNRVGNALLRKLLKGLDETHDPNMFEQPFTIALVAVFVVKNLQVDIESKMGQTLCKALLVKPDPEGKKCKELQIVQKYFPQKRKSLKEALVILGKQVATRGSCKDSTWLYLMPLIHFLSDVCKPYDKPDVDLNHDARVPVWWGISHIGEDALKSFKKSYGRWTVVKKNILEDLKPLFAMDYYLPRTILSAMELRDLSEVIQGDDIPMEICLASIIYQLRVNKPSLEYDHYRNYQYVSNMSHEEKEIEANLIKLLERLQGHFCSDTDNPVQWKISYKIAYEMLLQTRQADRSTTVYCCAQILIHCLAVYDSVSASKQCMSVDEYCKKVIKAATGLLADWFRNWWTNWEINMDNAIQWWDNTIAATEIQSVRIRDMWNPNIVKELSLILNIKICRDSWTMSNFVSLYCTKVDKFNACMQECLSTAAFKAIEGGYRIDYGTFSEDEKKRYGRLVSTLFMNEWNKVVIAGHHDEDEMVLKHVLMWPPFLQFLKIYYTDKKMCQLMSQDCVIRFVQAESAVESRVAALLNGAINIENLKLISTHDSRFSEIAEMVKGDKKHTKGFILKAILIRKKEIQAFDDQCELVSTLTALCTKLPAVDMKALDDTLDKQKDLDVHRVCEFVKPADVSQVIAEKDFKSELCAFKLSWGVLGIQPELYSCNRSNIFKTLWDKYCDTLSDKCNTLDDVVAKIWKPVKARWDEIAKSMVSGQINFRDMEKYLGRMYRDDYAGMKKEMTLMNLKEKVISERLGQLANYRQLGACVKGAKIILNFKREYKLNGDFEQIEKIAEHEENVMEMRQFDGNVMKTCDFLKEVTESRAKSLDAFVKCGKLIEWLKGSMGDAGLKELKVLVDLAFMSAGDEPLSIKRVQCLHSAVTGYGPLIFDLQQTAGYMDLLDICKIVWKELAADQHLPDKLMEIDRCLEWLKDVKNAHGSVEVTSLVQADAINANGIYTVGRKAYVEDTDDNELNVAHLLKLTVSEIEGKRQRRNYTFTSLQDLQSRLMLVAGKAEKGTESVDRFTSIFDSVTRLANVYRKLSSAGCVLFKDWTARFLCDKKKPVCAVLEFGQYDGSPTLKAKRGEDEDLVVAVPKIAKFMEGCLENWLMYIKEKRMTYIHLNYFTIDQLVILQRELVKLGTEELPSFKIYPLLSAVKKDCTPDDLLTAMAEAKTEIDNPAEMGETEEDANMGDDHNVDGDVNELRQKFIAELMDSGYDEKLALNALEHIEPSNIADGIVWCMNHDEEMELDSSDEDTDETELQQATPAGPAHRFEGWSQSNTSIQSLIMENIQGLKGTKNQGSSVNSLLQELDTLWANFLGSISSNIQDYLSLEHLGMILRKLAAKETNHVRRHFPPVFQEGTPNLIICPSGEVLNTVLSLYMLEKDQPLPQSDEILMCTPQTTIDEVDIFWRRAIFGGGKKIHCLVNSDYLDFDVSDAAERQLEQYIQETNHTGTENLYRLVVVCGSDNEYRSRIVASLDKHRRPALPVKPAALKEYLAVKLQQGQALSGIKPASFVDFNRSTVRVVKSWRAGVGKTLYKYRRENDLPRLNGTRVNQKTVSIPLQEKVINLHWVITRLLKHTRQPGTIETRLFHIDVAHEVQEGVDYLLFNLLVLGCLTDKTGFVWRKSPTDFYLIETLPIMILNNNKRGEDQFVHQMFNILPDMTCRSPQESLMVYNGNQELNGYEANDQLFDNEQFSSSTFQRPYQYLCRLDQARDLKDVRPDVTEGSPTECLQTLLRHCGVQDPSWAELHHFVWFLNTQLRDFETCEFVKAAAAEDLPGFAQFVLRFLIQMSRDFSTRSLKMSEESPGLREEKMEVTDEENGEGEDENLALEQYQLRRTWESSPHPYLFFNSDHFTFTFLGFYIDRAAYNLIDQQTGQVLEEAIMQKNLYDSLVRNFVPIQESFDKLPRDQKIMKMCNVMGIGMPHDPDDTYELTTDNVKKIMAIYMRFRCDIPVIIMGETGCGKTSLVKFMCSLQVPPGMDDVQNMILMKVHGGTTNTDIIKKVREAEEIAVKNVRDIGPHMYTVLFFDEANTTESIGLIKEIMCDKSMEGEKLKLCENLKMVAACNPYRKHSPDLIKKLEQAGLGYHVDADNTRDKLGRVPMRQLVYRVQPLPQSLLPLVWDFGQLNTQVEDLYIRQMVRRYIRMGKLPDIPNLIEVVSAILTASQDYMRDQKDECSFVSLRDVERVLSVMSWFYEKSQDDRTLFDRMDGLLDVDDVSDIEDEEDEDDEESYMDVEGTLDDVTRSLVLSLGVCYHACLKTRDRYREHVAPFFRPPCVLKRGPDQMEEEINVCQDVFLSNVQLENNIARNMALKENVFMMVVCIELRIPLFLVGKPGSSKSLAKTIVSDAMQGNASRKPLFKELKQAQMVSFQCSPLATPDGIVGTFRQCAQFQKDKDLDTFVSIVVLDEVGLAEDSPRMPLKTLHPLLEDGCQGDEKPEPFKKVAFIGISNWALDPAKMNRGILVQREVPDQEELINSARGICGKKVLNRIEPLIVPMCKAYLEVFMTATTKMREFFGLRDFYSLMKMVCAFAEKSKQDPTWHEILHAIKRNFGGLEQEKVDPEKFFKKRLAKKLAVNEKRKDTDPDSSAAGLIDACLFEKNRSHGESRYLLLLTENYGSLTILQQQILSRQRDIKPITIFGSSFRSDQEYTQVCRNINKIKVCMETGNTVVLLNLENLYESLYDALNQYYVYFGGERYVDLGLGTHRVKCPVHKKFRLIVVAEKQTVYEKFPIPLINRLEKHFLTINTMLSREQQKLAQKLEDWAKQFATQNDNNFLYKRVQKQKPTQKVGDVFMGYHDDTCSAIILHVCTNTKQGETSTEKILREAKRLLLWVATPQSVVRLNKSRLSAEEQKQLHSVYFEKQRHEGIVEYLHQKLVVEELDQLFVQVTTHSKLLATYQKTEISEWTKIPSHRIMLLDTLSSFDTEQQFSNKIQQYLQKQENQEPCLLIIQCDSGDVNANLVACARYCVMDEYQKVRDEGGSHPRVHVVFIVQLPNIAGGCYTGFQCGVWHSVHIDDLWTGDTNMPPIEEMQTKSVSNLIQDAVTGQNAMETNDEEQQRNTSETMDWEDEQIPPPREPGERMEMGEPVPSTSHHKEDIATSHTISLEDVIVGFELSGKRHTGPGKSLNVKNLILSCTQSALSMLKDKSENHHRTTERVSLVLTLFHGQHLDGFDMFLQGMCTLIASLLKEKDRTTNYGNRAERWLVNEAASQENIQKAGTFRRSCQLTLESKISPILAGILAHLDTNQNLDILTDSEVPWKRDMWLAVLNEPDALQLKYSDLWSQNRQSEYQEVVVLTTGCEGHIFKARMPFSWLIQQKLVEIMRTPMPDSEEEEIPQDKIDFYVRVFEKTPIGKVLSQFSDSNLVREMAEEYLHDFVSMCYKALSQEEMQLVCQSVRYLYNNTVAKCGYNSLPQLLLCIQDSYRQLAPRLTYFHTMNIVWPECSASIVKTKEENPDHVMFQEEEFTFSTLCLLIEHLTPNKTELDQASGRSRWLKKVHSFRPVIEKVLRLHAEDPAIYGAHSFQSVHRARCSWNRVVVIKLFLEHVCVVEKEENITVKQCIPLWKVLTEEADLKEIKSLEAIEKILKICNVKAIKHFLGGQEKCCFCEDAIEGPPIVLPCKDIYCDACYQNIAAMGDNKCLKCNKEIPKDWSLERQTEKRSEKKQLVSYQKRCNSFFMDVVSQLCFYDNTPPSEAVIDRLLQYITYTTKNNQKKVTKDMTIFNTGLDPNPVFRSFLLQLLMRTSEEKVMTNVNKYLKQADALLNQPQSRPVTHHGFIELSQLVIQCLEDILTQKLSKCGDPLAESTRCLRRAMQTIFSDELNVEKLYGIAEARLALATVANVLADIMRGKMDIDTKVRRLIEAAETLCENGRTEYPKNTSETMDWEDEQIPPPREPGERMEMGEPVPSTSHHEEDIATSHTISLEDVIVGFELSGKRHTGPGKSLNVKNLILSCTQSALSMLKDKSENHHRTTERVSLVLTLFHGQHLDGFDMFLQGMCTLIASLLKEKDRTTNYGNRAERWLVNEAASQENIQKAGTFRRSCQLTLESKISPILAGILAHLDTNQNLDILTDSEVPWKRDMWLAVLNEPDALQLKYSDLWSQNRQSEYQEVVVLTTGCEGHIFKARMPFSWLIQQKLVEIMRTPMPDSEEEEIPQDKIDFYVRVFEKTPIGKVLSQFSDSNLVREMAEEYLHDFVSMCYKALSQEEMQLVCQSVRYLYNNTVAKCGYNSLPQLLLCIQDSYRQLAPRLTYFHTMNIVWPECSASIVKTKEENPDHVMFQEEEFTFSTLCLLIEHLTPNKTELDQASGRSRWLKKVHSFRPVIEKVLRLHAEDPAIYGAHSFQSVHRARCSWNRVVVIKLFLEHVCVVEKEENITVKQCIPLWKVLTEEADLKEIKSLEAIEKILKICNVKAIKHFLGGQEKCCFCEDAIEGPPIVLPCKDIYCDACYQNIAAMGDNKCLKCNKEIPKDWSLERQTEKRSEKKQLVSYQKRCNSFFMDVVSQLCFYDNTPPSEAVIDRLLQYITYTTKNNQKKVTKDMTIFNTGLDPNPVFRSFLLQLLMRTSEEKVMTNVNKYLKQADALLNQPQSRPVTHHGFIELSQLVIQCLEDILTQKLSKCGDPLAESTRCLRRAMQTIFSDELNVEKLYGIAEARLALATVANVLADIMRGKMDIDTKVRRLIEAAETLCENGRTEYPKNTSETMDWEDEQIPPPREPGERMEMGEPVPSTSHHEEDIATSHTISLEDVIVGFELSGKRHTGPGKSLNVKNLILSCTQSALSMLKDKSENHHRTTERVSLVLTLFHGQHLDGFDMFLQGMCTLIASLLKEKDRTTNYGNRAERWLVNEAASQENIQKAGTFRRSCQLTLESKISPILAGILAHLDTNQNLDILTDSEVPWKRDMWLAVLNEPDALQLKYSDLWSQNRQSEYQEVVVLTTGCEGHIFKARMPFSWLIQQKLVEIMRTPMPDSEEEEIPQDKIDFYVRVFEKTPIGKVLSQFSDSNLVREMAEEYLHDFVSMCYKALSQEEMQLVCQSVRYLYNNTVAKCGYNSLPQLLLCIQDSYRQLAPRLTYFHTMNIVWPECSASIVKTKEENPDHVMFQEEEFTFSTLCLLIEHLTPNKTELDQASGRSRWLKKVHSFRPVIEKVLRLHAEDPAIYGAHSFQSVHRARCSWNRVVVIKLFLEHVCVVEKEENITVKQCIPLWKVLTEEADLKEIKSLEAIEKILKICNVKAIKHFLGGQEKCCFCEDAIEGPPIVLPCKDIYCDACYQNIAAMGDNKCLKCNKEIPKDWSLERQTEKRSEKKQLVSYQKRCNSFFMDVVSQLCFYDNTPPSEAVIDRLLQYITYTTKNNQKKVTKDMTIFNTGLDPNPVFRSFLLQLLMRTSEEKVMTNVNKYLKQADALLNQPQSRPVTHHGFIELSQLVIQCLEDILTQKLSKCGDPLAESTRCLRRAMQTIFSDELNVEKLYGIAEARLALATVANVLADIMRGKMDIDTKVRRLIEAAETLCENGRTEYPKIYLVKYMCRRFGIDIYQQVCQSEKRFLMWIAQGGRQENKRVEISDRYVLCGQTYTTIREALTKVVLGEDIQHLDETLQGLTTSQPHVNTLLSLALYREITCSLLYPTQQRKIKDKERQLLHDYLQASSNKEILQNYLDNTWQTCPHLKVQEGMDFRHQGLQTLLVHFLSVTSHLQEDRTLLGPFIGIIRTPQQYVNCFIPTMPQDDLDDVKQALLAARDVGGGENPVFYRCPRGHPYVIGNCGRPYVVERCKCGEEIGGRSHVLLQTNKLDQGADETETGHILGPVGNRERGPRPERQMTPLYCACVRLFTHLSMYLGTMTDPQAIQTMIKPGVPKEQVADYLWRHLQADMDDLEKGLERSIDDTFVLLHTIIDHIMKTHDKGRMVNDQVRKLTTKKGRNDFENQFVTQFLQPVIQKCDVVLHHANQRLVKDQRLGADPLLCLLYEIDTQQVEESPNNIENIPSVWRYRLAITLGHLTQAFEAKKAAAKGHDKQLAVLDLFLKEEHYLRAIRCIPSILKLQRELLHKYQRKLEKVAIVNSKLTIGYIKREKIAGEETEQLVEDFETAWNICRKSLKQYLCPTELGGMVVREEFCRPVNDDTPIAILLPAIKDEGLCSYAMLDFLLRKQNDFLDKYATETSKTQKRSTDNIGKVQPMEVTSAHLISYDPQQDLLPLILANCQYSFEIGKGTNLEYDFMSLERQIMDRFLFSKSKIDVGPFLQIDLMIYAAEFTDGEVFDKLAEIIQQEELSSAIKTQICLELKSLPELCQSLNNLDITISFLKSIGGNPDESLERFMSETLQMKHTVHSQKVRQSCLFKHIKALWLLLALEKSKKMAEHRQPIENICESVSAQFQELLPEASEAELREFMRDISVDKLGDLVSTLHEYILLVVAVRENRDNEEYVDTTDRVLKVWLAEYSDEKTSVLQILNNFPDSILYKHSVYTWVTAYSVLYEKKTGDRRF